MDFAVLASLVISSRNCKMAMFEILHCLNLWGFFGLGFGSPDTFSNL